MLQMVEYSVSLVFVFIILLYCCCRCCRRKPKEVREVHTIERISTPERIMERERIVERVLVVCPYCGSKNQQGLSKCQQCDADL